MAALQGASEPDDEVEEGMTALSLESQMSEEDREEARRNALDPKQKLVCRFYENEFPELEEVVMVNVRNVEDLGAYVNLLEYNHYEGMILLSELSRRRIRSVNKLIKAGRNEVAMVTRVDYDKKYIDLSKRRVSPEDIVKADERYSKAKNVHKILSQLVEYNPDQERPDNKDGKHTGQMKAAREHAPDPWAHQRGKWSLKQLYTAVGWPLYKKYGHCYDAFKLVLSGADDVFDGIEPPVPQGMLNMLVDEIKKRLAPQPIKIRADVDVWCYQYAGIDAVVSSLRAGQVHGTAESPVKVKLIAPPGYVVTTTTLDKDFGIEMLTKAIKSMSDAIEAQGGKLEVRMAPKAVSARDESDLAAVMARLEAEKTELDGDDDDEAADE